MATIESRTWVSTFLLAGAFVVAPVLAQDAEVGSQRSRGLVPWAPKWSVGDWWVVRVYQPHVDVVDPCVGEEEAPRGRSGAPAGFEPANRLLFRVVRRELVRYAGEGDEVPPEAFLVVEVRSLDGLRARSAELWYTEEDLSLAKVDFPYREGEGVLTGTAQAELAASHWLGVPLEWPDFLAARKERASLYGHHRLRLRQEVQVQGEGRVRVRLTAPAPKQKAAAEPGLPKPATARVRTRAPQVQFEWRDGSPSWSRVRTHSSYAELVRHGAGELPPGLRAR